MKVQTILVILFSAMLLAFTGDGRLNKAFSANASVEQKQIKFVVKTIEQKGETEELLSEATIAGAPGTDFNIVLQDKHFKMDAKFMTDVVGVDSLAVHAALNTRRLYGYSERELPLYEEDVQDATLHANLGDKLILLPFGQRAGDKLKIEIIPLTGEETAYLPSGAMRSISIKIQKSSPGGIINIQATRIPHRFSVEISLFENGNQIARGEADYLLKQAKEIILQPTGTGDPLAVNLTIDQFQRYRPIDQIDIQFDIHRIVRAENDKREAVALDWAGAGNLGSSLNYPLNEYGRSSGKTYSIKFTVKLASGESQD